MRYINRLEAEAQAANTAAKATREQIDDLVSYLNSSKFRCGDELDGYVNIQDILPRLFEMRSSLQDILD